jgi:hypothetical protein
MEKQAFKSCFFVLLGFMLILLSIALFQLYRLSNAYSPTETSRVLFFPKHNKTIYFKGSSWGLLGNHEEIYLTEFDDKTSNVKRDVVFYTNELYYNMNEDTLFIFQSSQFDRNFDTIFGNVFLSVRSLTPIDELSYNQQLNYYRKNHKMYGLNRFSIYD